MWILKTPDWLASDLLERRIVMFPSQIVCFTGGLLSIVYCNLRFGLGMYDFRTKICHELFLQVVERWSNWFGDDVTPDRVVVAAVATAGIGWGIGLADELNCDYCTVRDVSKTHGLGHLIDGVDVAGKYVVLVEDLVSEATSSARAAKALLDAGAHVVIVCSIVTYGFEAAAKRFAALNVRHTALIHFETIAKEIADQSLSLSEEVFEWLRDADGWTLRQLAANPSLYEKYEQLRQRYPDFQVP